MDALDAVIDTSSAVVHTLVWDKADVCNYWLYILHDASSVLTACVDHVTAVSQHTHTPQNYVTVRPVVCKCVMSLLDTQSDDGIWQ